jgi:hypothetical protein
MGEITQNGGKQTDGHNPLINQLLGVLLEAALWAKYEWIASPTTLIRLRWESRLDLGGGQPAERLSDRGSSATEKASFHFFFSFSLLRALTPVQARGTFQLCDLRLAHRKADW